MTIKSLLGLCLISHAVATPLGNLGAGITAKDSATGDGYIMFSPTDLSARFTLHTGQATNFVAVYYQSSTWYYYNDETAVSFTPVATDVLVASVDYSADTLTLLDEGLLGNVHGIKAGYADGDISITVNQYNGVADTGEFEVSGTYVSLNQPMQTVEHGTNCKLKWDNISGRSYFMQWSLDMESWSFFPEVEHGESDYEYNFTCTDDKMFVRLVYSDVQMTDPETYDLDGDGVGNLAEISDTNNQTDPFKLDTNEDGIDDGGLADRDGDGIPTAYEIANGLDPLVANGAVDLANYLASLTTTSSSLEVFTDLK